MIDSQGGIGSISLIEVEPGERYVLQANGKSIGSSSWSGFGVHYFDVDNNQIGQDFIEITSLEYSNYSTIITTPQNVVKIRVWCWMNGEGTFFIDDLSFSLAPNISPVAETNGNYEGILGEEITFSSEGSYDPDGTLTNYLWDFGDGFTSSVPNPTHSYSSEGTFKVTLTVTDDQGSKHSSSAFVIILENTFSECSNSLVINSGFEENLDMWTNWGNAFISSESFSGLKSLLINAQGGIGSTSLISVEPGEDYMLQAYAKRNENSSWCGFGIHYFDRTDNQIGQDFIEVSSIEYSIYSNTFTIPDNVVKVRLWCWMSGVGSFYIDDICFGKRTKQTSFYVNNNGDDNNSGTISSPWKTLSRVGEQDLEPGDAVYLSGGQVFEDFIELSSEDSGSDSEKVLLTSYGEGRAIINAGNGKGIYLNNVSNVDLNNIDVVGTGRKGGNTEDGVLVYRSNFVDIDSMDISGFQHRGLFIHESNDVNVKYVDAHDNGYAGIESFGEWQGIRNTNIYIGHCTAINNPGDPTVLNNHSGNGILAGETDNVIIEYCHAENNGWDMPRAGNGPVGIWLWHCDNGIIQYCISNENKTSENGSDGGGFDLDGGVTNSILQYNISYRNEGPGIGLFEFNWASKWYNNIIRYNITENDGLKNEASINIWNGNRNAEDFKDAYIYNNVVYNEYQPCIKYFDHFLDNFNFSNNIFVYNGDGVEGIIDSSKEKYIGNLWYRLEGGFSVDGYTNFYDWANITGNEKYNDEIVGINTNPYFNNVGNSSIVDPLQITSYNSYRLLENSPAIDSAMDVNILYDISSGTQDLFGNAIPFNDIFDMGVNEFNEINNLQAKTASNSYNEEISFNKQFYILENPVKSKEINFFFQSESSLNNEFVVQIYDAKGKYFFNKKIKINNNHIYQIDLKPSFNAGIYLLMIKQGRNNYNSKIIIE